jgi:hypothetical protein
MIDVRCDEIHAVVGTYGKSLQRMLSREDHGVARHRLARESTFASCTIRPRGRCNRLSRAPLTLTSDARSRSARPHTRTRELALTRSADTSLSSRGSLLKTPDTTHHLVGQCTQSHVTPVAVPRGVELRGRRIDFVLSPADMTFSGQGAHALVSNLIRDRRRPPTCSSATTCVAVGDSLPA